MKERLELVKNFGELKAGMIVVTKNCLQCGNNHRAMLLRPTERYWNINGQMTRIPGWTEAPEAHWKCGPASITVEQHRLFRVFDGLEQSQTIKTRKSVRA